jgi:hypothetical protein
MAPEQSTWKRGRPRKDDLKRHAEIAAARVCSDCGGPKTGKGRCRSCANSLRWPQKTNACAACGKQFPYSRRIGPRKTCSQVCAKQRIIDAAKSRGASLMQWRECQQCGVKFRRYNPVSGVKRDKFCSRDCSFCALIERAKARSAERNSWRAPRYCKQCGSTFVPKKRSMVNCSAECARQSQPAFDCIACGKRVNERRTGQWRYCSPECSKRVNKTARSFFKGLGADEIPRDYAEAVMAMTVANREINRRINNG